MIDVDDPIAHLRTAEQPPAAELASAPILDDWEIARPAGAIERQFCARGAISGSGKFPAGHGINTSDIMSADRSGRWIRTRNTLYRLGGRRQEMPLVVLAATQPDWITAWLMIRGETGRHTVPYWTWSAVLTAGHVPSNGPVDWPRRRAAAAAVGNELARAGRPFVADAWMLLGAAAGDKQAAASIYEILCTAAGSHQTPLASDCIDGWGMLAKGGEFGIDMSDCIAAARELGAHHQKQPKTPLLLRMVRAPNSIAAAKILMAEVDIAEIAAADTTTRNLVSSVGDIRRPAAKAALDWRAKMGLYDHIQVCLRLLALDPIDRIGCNLIRSKVEGCLLDAGVDPEADRLWRAWRSLAAGLTPPAYPNDPIMSAWALASTAIEDLRGTDALREVFVEDTYPGVVVLPKVGGTTETTSGKEAAREFKEIAGKRLLLVTVADLVGIRTALRDEFPHLHQSIDVLLSDFTEGEPIRLRPTLLVGKPGGGKSRLARRLAESLDVGLHRYDAAGSGDNTFGGTPRRWSSGEHCAPLEAVRRFEIANPWILIDEIDKGASGSQNGSLVNALLPLLDGETSARYPDPFVQIDVDLSKVSYVLTANNDTLLPSPLRDRLRVVRLPEPDVEHLPALARGVVADIAKERGGDVRWFPALEDGELAVVEGLWPGGSVRRLRAIVERILAHREQRPRN